MSDWAEEKADELLGLILHQKTGFPRGRLAEAIRNGNREKTGTIAVLRSLLDEMGAIVQRLEYEEEEHLEVVVRTEPATDTQHGTIWITQGGEDSSDMICITDMWQLQQLIDSLEVAGEQMKGKWREILDEEDEDEDEESETE